MRFVSKSIILSTAMELTYIQVAHALCMHEALIYFYWLDSPTFSIGRSMAHYLGLNFVKFNLFFSNTRVIVRPFHLENWI